MYVLDLDSKSCDQVLSYISRVRVCVCVSW